LCSLISGQKTPKSWGTLIGRPRCTKRYLKSCSDLLSFHSARGTTDRPRISWKPPKVRMQSPYFCSPNDTIIGTPFLAHTTIPPCVGDRDHQIRFQSRDMDSMKSQWRKKRRLI